MNKSPYYTLEQAINLFGPIPENFSSYYPTEQESELQYCAFCNMRTMFDVPVTFNRKEAEAFMIDVLKSLLDRLYGNLARKAFYSHEPMNPSFTVQQISKACCWYSSKKKACLSLIYKYVAEYLFRCRN